MSEADDITIVKNFREDIIQTMQNTVGIKRNDGIRGKPTKKLSTCAHREQEQITQIQWWAILLTRKFVYSNTSE